MKLHWLIAVFLVTGCGSKKKGNNGSQAEPATYSIEGSTVFNGGDGVVCRDGNDNIESVVVLDIYEASLDPNYKLSLGDKNDDYKKKINFALDRLAKLDPMFAKHLRKKADDFSSGGALFIKDHVLEDVKDEGSPAVLKPNCKLHQLAVQINSPSDRKHRYIINQDLWNLLDNDNKAALVLHEVIFNGAITRGHKHSVEARYFNALLLSREFKSYSKEKFREYIGKIKIVDITYDSSFKIFYENAEYSASGIIRSGIPEHPASIEIEGLKIDLYKDKPVLFYRNGRIREIVPCLSFFDHSRGKCPNSNTKKYQVKRPFEKKFNWTRLPHGKTSRVELFDQKQLIIKRLVYPSGLKQYVRDTDAWVLLNPYYSYTRNIVVWGGGGYIEFYKNGLVKSTNKKNTINHNNVFVIKGGKGAVTTLLTSEFREDGTLRQATASGWWESYDTHVILVDGTKLVLKKRSNDRYYMEFNKQGYVTKYKKL